MRVVQHPRVGTRTRVGGGAIVFGDTSGTPKFNATLHRPELWHHNKSGSKELGQDGVIVFMPDPGIGVIARPRCNDVAASGWTAIRPGLGPDPDMDHVLGRKEPHTYRIHRLHYVDASQGIGYPLSRLHWPETRTVCPCLCTACHCRPLKLSPMYVPLLGLIPMVALIISRK